VKNPGIKRRDTLDLTELITVVEENFLLSLSVAIFIAALIFLITRWLLATTLNYIASRSKTRYDNILIENLKPFHLAWITPLLVIYFYSYLLPDYKSIIEKIVLFLIIWIVTITINALLNAFNEIYESSPNFSGVSIKGYLDIGKILIVLVAVILSISLFTDQSPIALLSGLGAITAILLLIFRDTILSLVASIQISAYDMIKQGDWIEVPSYGVDGDVMDISLHTIKIQNFDKTFTMIPTYKIIEVGYRNWRGMQESGGRRIKRSIYLDIASIKLCSMEELERYQKINLIKNYVSGKIQAIGEEPKQDVGAIDSPLNSIQLSNATVYRTYIEAYLRSRQDIHSDGMTFLIRQLAPGPTGLPIELYIFTTTVDWIEYEMIQAEIFDHLLAAASYFDLCIFQQPTGRDVSMLALNQ
jgi:miniconductance mechanosensitive channel